jgi:hypothetical protein
MKVLLFNWDRRPGNWLHELHSLEISDVVRDAHLHWRAVPVSRIPHHELVFHHNG